MELDYVTLIPSWFPVSPNIEPFLGHHLKFTRNPKGRDVHVLYMVQGILRHMFMV